MASQLTTKSLVVTVLLLLLLVSTAVLLYSRLGDRVFLSNTSRSEIGILVDADGLPLDKSFVSSRSTIRVGRLQAAVEGSNEVIAFTAERPVAIVTPVSWTSGNDNVNVAFSDRITIPVTIWILQGPFMDQKDLAEQRCEEAVGMWNAERMGVAFSEGGCEVVDATNNLLVERYLYFRCALQNEMQTNIGKAADRINIYVVDIVVADGVEGTGNGNACATNNFIVLGSTADSTLLVHELGHTFSLRHSDTWPDFDDTNFMKSFSSVRQYFTEGQVFRAHLMAMPASPPGSALNEVYHARPGQPTRDCPSRTTNDQCPAIDKRIWADGPMFPPN